MTLMKYTTKVMNNWKEENLFDWLKQNVYLDLVKAKNQMSRWDCYSPNAGHRIELKCRKKHYDTLLLEKKKYDAMVTEANKHLDTPVYINSTPEGIYSFNLYFIRKDWEVNFRNPATTQFAKTGRILKEVTYLKTTDGNKLR